MTGGHGTRSLLRSEVLFACQSCVIDMFGYAFTDSRSPLEVALVRGSCLRMIRRQSRFRQMMGTSKERLVTVPKHGTISRTLADRRHLGSWGAYHRATTIDQALLGLTGKLIGASVEEAHAQYTPRR